MRIPRVDDNAGYHRLFRAVISKGEHFIFDARSDSEAIEMYRQFRPDLVV
jgi:chemotaxis response regulator CheB